MAHNNNPIYKANRLLHSKQYIGCNSFDRLQTRCLVIVLPWTRFRTTIQPLKHIRRSHGDFIRSLQVSEDNFVSTPTGRPASSPCLRVPNQTREWGILVHPTVTRRNLIGALPICWVIRCARFNAQNSPPAAQLPKLRQAWWAATQILTMTLCESSVHLWKMCKA